MNICIISNLYPPNILGGAEIIVEKMATNIAKEGHNITVITTSPDYEEHKETRDNTTIYYINTTKIYPPYQQTKANAMQKPLWHLFDLWNNNTKERIKEIIKEEKCELIHINNFKGLSLSCFKAGRELEIPVIFESHDFSLICPRANLIKGNNTLCKDRGFICNQYVNIQRKLLNDNVDLLISPSNFMIDKYHENNFFNNIPCVKIPLGVEYEKVKSNKSYDKINITYIGTLGKHKGVHTLIEAFKMIDNPHITLNIIGKGYDEEEFKQLAQPDSRIVFHGFINNEDIKEYYDTANIMVIPSICYDNSPLVIYESFSRSTPVIGSNIGGIPELVNDGFNGYLFDAENPYDLKDKLLKVINNKDKLKILEENAYNSINDESIKDMTDDIIKEYEKILRK